MIAASFLCGTANAGWVIDQANDVETVVTGDVTSVRTTGPDPYVVWRASKPFEATDRVLEFEYFCLTEIGSVSAILGPPITEPRRIDLPDITVAEGWQRYRADLGAAEGRPISDNVSLLRIDFGMTANVRIQIRDLQIRRRTTGEAESHSRELRRRKQKIAAGGAIEEYLASDFPIAFDDIIVDDKSVTLRGSVADPERPRSLVLVEYPPHHSIVDRGIPLASDFKIEGGDFRVQVPRMHDGRDRLHSAWRLRWGAEHRVPSPFVSARQFATQIVPETNDHPIHAARPRSQKGLTGLSHRGPRSDLVDLGIHAVTLNLVLNDFVTREGGEGRERISVPGPPVFFDSRVLARYDELMDFARRHDIVVTAIVLIRRSKRTGPQSPLVHPQSSGGIYCMPDLSSVRGTGIYSHVLDRIARRYRSVERHPGGIANWIAHNEVDFHTVWTNMGLQPPQVYSETYYRSLRMIHNAARRHNPHARVFASLTHHWVVPEQSAWKRLAPREFLETLQRYSHLEGDFAWGVAYHPYPQSLFAAVAWEDTLVRDDLDTPLITIQNIEVLGRFLEQDSMRDSRGEMRPVLLSEQGFHTDSYELESQARQAGSLWYAMKKIRSMSWIESFHYHRWIDHPNEGGLMLGLRTLPDDTQAFGRRKRSWYVYQAIGTEQEAELTAGLPGP